MSKNISKRVATRRGRPRTSDNDKKKENWRKASRRYYAKKPKNPPRIPYSPEEKKRRRKKTNARYYAKNREKILTKFGKKLRKEVEGEK